MFTIATWNINSVRLREGLVARFLREEAPDVLCLQECKSPVEKIPAELFYDLGYRWMVARGQRGYNGVAILSRLPLEDAGDRDYARLGGGRGCNLDLRDVQLPADALLGDGSDALPAIETVVDHAMAALGADFQPSIQCDNFMVLKELVSTSLVISLAPWDVIAQDVASGRLAPLPLQPGAVQHSAYGIVSRAGHSLSPGAAELRRLLLAQEAATEL